VGSDGEKQKEKEEVMLVVDGDRRFEGVDERRGPDQLPAGTISRGINVDLTRGVIETRKGFRSPQGLAAKCFSFPFDFNLNFDEQGGHGQLFGAMPYTSQFGEHYHILALERYAVRVHHSGSAVIIRYPLRERDCLTQTLELQDDVVLVQAYNRVFMFRGRSKRPLVWDGVEHGMPQFVEVSKSPSGIDEAGVEPMPNSKLALYYLNRLWVLKGKDELLFSDVGVESDFTLTNSFKIDSGSFDSVIGLKAFGDNAILVFKEKSIDVLENLQGDLTLNGTRTRLSNEIGLASADCVTDCGADVWFLSERGVFSVKQSFQSNKLRSDAEPISAPLEPVFRRINWSVKSQFRSAFYENKYYLFCALDDALVNDTVIVYSFITKSWHGYHQADFADWQYAYVNFEDSEKYLFGINNEGRIYTLYIGYNDEVAFNTAVISQGAYSPKTKYKVTASTSSTDFSNLELFSVDGDRSTNTIAAGIITAGTTFVTGDIQTPTAYGSAVLTPQVGVQDFTMTAHSRGYGAIDLDRKQFNQIVADVSTWCSNYTISHATDGANEDVTTKYKDGSTDSTRNRLKYHTVGTKRFLPNNQDDNYNDKYREDYSTFLCPSGFTFPFSFPFSFTGACGSNFAFPFDFPFSFTSIPSTSETEEICVGTNGICIDQFQLSEDPRAIMARGDWIQVKIVNTSGRIRIRTMKVEGKHINRTSTISV